MTEKPGRALEAVLKLAALEERTAELKGSLDRIELKLEGILDRIARVETRYEELSQRNLAVDPTESPRAEAEAPGDAMVGGMFKIGSED